MTVIVNVTGVSIIGFDGKDWTGTSVTLDAFGLSYKQSAKIFPDNASNKQIEWVTSDKNAVTVKYGVIQVNNTNETVTTARASNGKGGKGEITV